MDFQSIGMDIGVMLLASPFLFAAEAQMREGIVPFAGPSKEWMIYQASVRFSADQKHLAYICRLEKKFAVIFDGQMSSTYDGISQDSPFLSPDGTHVAYRAVKATSGMSSGTERKGPPIRPLPHFCSARIQNTSPISHRRTSRSLPWSWTARRNRDTRVW